MKKLLFALILCGSLALLFAGCAPADTPVDDPPVDDPAVEQDGRPATSELAVSREGTEEMIAVALWQEEDFSMYMPSEGWTMSEDKVWSPDLNADVRFYVEYYADATEDEIIEQIMDYATTDEAREQLIADPDMSRYVQTVESAEGCYAQIAEYPVEAAEGFGALLRAMMDTFELN